MEANMTFTEFRAEVLKARARKAGRTVGQVVRFPGAMPKKSGGRVADWLLTYGGGGLALVCWVATCWGR